MIDIFGFGDPERWIIIGFICLSLYFLWSNTHILYDRLTKIILTIPRVYLILYEIFVITDIYNIIPSLSNLVRTGIGSAYGLLLLFGVEAYVRWVNKKYGRC